MHALHLLQKHSLPADHTQLNVIKSSLRDFSVILAGQGTLREFPAVNYCSVHIFSSGKNLMYLF
jgi:hypothetical protein